MLVPVLVVALLGNTPAGDVLAAVVFALASLTDFVDGYLARARDSITTFGKLMDPLADKLLIVAALVSLVSLHRLAAWVAMVIITRELAVTVLRLGATQAGVVMAASMFGKVKTCLQIAAILAVIAVHGTPLWVVRAALPDGARHRALGPGLLLRHPPADGQARKSAGREALETQARRLSGGRPPSAEAPASSHSSRVVWCGAGAPVSISSRSSASRPWRSATTLCWWIVSRFSWRAETKLAPSRSANALDRRPRSSRARSPPRSAAGGAPSPPPPPRRSASSARRSPRTCCPRRSPAASRASISAVESSVKPICSVARPRWLCVATGTCSRMRSICSARSHPPPGARAHAPATSSCAHGHAVMPCADTPTVRRVPCSNATARPCSV
jgi:CDP-diacylglycerol--glycerol-3-phosphate 3-phosphatidyltransferase